MYITISEQGTDPLNHIMYMYEIRTMVLVCYFLYCRPLGRLIVQIMLQSVKNV